MSCCLRYFDIPLLTCFTRKSLNHFDCASEERNFTIFSSSLNVNVNFKNRKKKHLNLAGEIFNIINEKVWILFETEEQRIV